MPEEIVLDSSVNIQALTDVGRARNHNEDNFIVCPNLGEKRWYLSDGPETLTSRGCLLVVADGMGGANAGEVASEIAVASIQEQFDSLTLEPDPEEAEVRELLQRVILVAHQAIVAAAQQNPEHTGMGTTIVIAWVFKQKAYVAWVGDSRAYHYSKEQGLELLTSDHSLVWELVKAGKLTPDEADVHPDSNIITQSLGDAKHVPEPEFTSCSIAAGSRLLLCSDGLNNMLSHKTIESLLAETKPLAQICQMLIRYANDEGGRDNTTVLALEVLGQASKKKFFNLFGLFSGPA